MLKKRQSLSFHHLLSHHTAFFRWFMKQLHLDAIHYVDGKVNLPGSKSISNRALLMAALAQGTTEITNLLFSDDVKHMLNALQQLGVCIHIDQNNKSVKVEGVAGPFKIDKSLSLFLGNAGTAYRPLLAVLALSSGEFTLTGEPRMNERPVQHLVDALRSVGAEIEYQEQAGYPPVKVSGKQLQKTVVDINGSLSSQYISALLIAAPLFEHGLEINIIGECVSQPYIAITTEMMKQFGIDVNVSGQRYWIEKNQQYQAIPSYWVEGDASSASYFLAAAAISGGTVEVYGVGNASLQGDKHFAHVLAEMGAKIEWRDHSIRCTKGTLDGVDMDMNHIPDAAMTIATTALFAQTPSCISNVYNWRIKETDRLYAMATELKKLGAQVEEGKDYLKIWPLKKIQYAAIDTYNDHRMAMCFSLIAVGGFEVLINDPDCVNKTFPSYFETLASISSS